MIITSMHRSKMGKLERHLDLDAMQALTLTDGFVPQNNLIWVIKDIILYSFPDHFTNFMFVLLVSSQIVLLGSLVATLITRKFNTLMLGLNV